MDAPTIYALFFTPCGLAIVALAASATLAGVLIARSISFSFPAPRNRRGH